MRILIAEDEASNRRLLEVSVRKWGHEPVLAHDGREAWELLEGPDAPTLAMLDWMMPGVDGVEICRRLRAHAEQRMIYVIMVTTNAQPGDIVAGLEAGADDYVTKPFDPQELRARVDVGVRMVELHRRLAEQQSSLAAAQARLAGRARFETAVGAMSDGIVTADDQWRITYANRAAALLLNLVEREWEGLALEEALAGFELSEPVDALRESAEATSGLMISRRGAGPSLWIEARVTRLFDEEGRLTDVVLALRDATDRVNAESRETRFMHSISHKLRTPLTVIGGSLDLMAHLPAERLPEVWERVLPICQRQVRRLGTAVERLLEYRALSVGEQSALVAPVEPAEVIDEVERALRERYAGEEIEFERSIAPDAGCALAGADEVRLVIEELAENAIKFAERRPVQVRISVRREPDGMVGIAVSDAGPGIPHEYLDRVFEGYVQVEETETGQVEGLGLGLRLVRQVVEAHGGKVAIRSEIGRGTTVMVTFPAGESECAEGQEAPG